MFPERLAPENSVSTQDADEFQKILRDAPITRHETSLKGLGLNSAGQVQFQSNDGVRHELPFTQNFLEDAVRLAKIPRTYALQIGFELLNENFRARRATQDCPLVVAEQYGRAVGLANQTRPAGTLDVFSYLPTGLKFHRGQMTDRGVEVDWLFEGAAPIEPQPGDVILEGIRLTNSETGGGGLKLERFTHRLVCRNGAVVTKLDDTIRWSYDVRMTYHSSLEKVGKQLLGLLRNRRPFDALYRTAVTENLTEESLFNVWRRVQRSGLPADRADEALGLVESLRNDMQAAIRLRAADLTPHKDSGLSIFEVHNRVTFFAHTQRLQPQVRSRLELIGGDVLSVGI